MFYILNEFHDFEHLQHSVRMVEFEMDEDKAHNIRITF